MQEYEQYQKDLLKELREEIWQFILHKFSEMKGHIAYEGMTEKDLINQVEDILDTLITMIDGDIKSADQLANNSKELECEGCKCTNIPGDNNETSAPFYEVKVWNEPMTEIEGKEIYCSECLSNVLTEEPETIFSVKQIWISDYELNLRREKQDV